MINGYKGKLGLELASPQAKIFEYEHDRKPRGQDFNSIVGTKGYWQKFGIHNWIDFAYFVFGDYDRYPTHHWNGEDGLSEVMELVFEI